MSTLIQFLTIVLLFIRRMRSLDLDPNAVSKCEQLNGFCERFQDCTQAVEDLKRGIRPKLTCGFSGKEPVVCCPYQKSVGFEEVVDEEESMSTKMCSEYSRGTICNYIFGGESAAPTELKFMVLVGYGPENEISWQCGGSLISEKYVLSAAHCSQSDLGTADWARLGEFDLSTEEDEARPIDVRITVRIIHPGYRPPQVYNDIALFRLEKEAGFNSFIKPICLQPTMPHQIDSVIVAGWGRVETVGPSSPRLLKAELDIFPSTKCHLHETATTQLPKGIDKRSMICAGAEGGLRDTCLGDSGGPLFLKPTPCGVTYQVGVTSFGRLCGSEEYPGVYTKVSNYIKWIESVVWPLNQSDPTVIWST